MPWSDKAKRITASIDWNRRNRNKCNLSMKLYYRRLRRDALIAYSINDIPSCSCCNEAIEEFLVIDHIEGNGNKHRREIHTSTIYSWLKTNKYPPGFQVLCENCNGAKSRYGTCPHQRSKNV